jgi:hypothetical protein
MTLGKLSLIILFACSILFLIHFLYTADLENRQQRLHAETGKFLLTLVDERVNALGDRGDEVYADLITSLSDYFDLEEGPGIVVFRKDTHAVLYPTGATERTAPEELLGAIEEKNAIEGDIRFRDGLGYFVDYKPLGVSFVVFSRNSDLFLQRNQLLAIAAVLIFFFALILMFIDARIKGRLGTVLDIMKERFERAFVKRGKLLQRIEPQGVKKIDGMIAGYNTMVRKADRIYGQMENRIQTLFQQRENLKKIIALYKKYSHSETVSRISEKNLYDLESKRQPVSSLSIELIDYLGPIDELYPQVITNELSSLFNFVKSQAVGGGGLINFACGYFMNIVFGVPTSDERSFQRAVECARNILNWVEERNGSERNVSGVKWDIKMGLSHGFTVAGTVGDGYVVIGVPVETSMRMLDHAHHYGVALVTDCLERLEELESIRFRRLDRVPDDTGGKVREIYEIFLRDLENIEDGIKLYYHGLDMFFEKKYDIAVFDFKKVNQIFNGDSPSLIFLKRCESSIKSR